LTTQPIIEVRDAAGNLVTTATPTITATIATGGGTVTGSTATAVGGVATFLVALLPLPSPSGSAATHTEAASTAFIALAVWPVLAARSRPDVPMALRRKVAGTATLVLVLLVAWLLVELRSGGPAVGLSERVAAAAQALWPLAVVLSCRWSGHRRPPRAKVSTTS